ncbi:hypothetical protein M426DRAFT_71042 [Hypoxylon sp. CI-4A]|nr:hypothetical protein M426DRAFT_71042 [Hypoxylon sp. CI-4A]
MVSLAPSLEDLILAGPRMLTKLGILSFPDAVDGFGQRVIADPTPSDYFFTTTTSEMLTQVSEAVADAAANVLEEDEQDPTMLVSKFSSDNTRGLGSVFSYATSKWALCCVAMAIILNRTHIFAASRRRLHLTGSVRLFLRFFPILFFAYQARQLLQSIQCQTSPDFSELRWGNSTKTSDLMFAQPSSYLHGLSTVLLLGATDHDSCRAVEMIPQDNYDSVADLRGSLSLLWPLFGTLCLSHFIETISCAVQGRPVAVETGMTLFEHSLAFAEADAAVSNQLGWGLFSSGSPTNVTIQQASGGSRAITRSMIMKRVNTPPEVLLVAFLSAMSHITSHVLGVFGLQSKFRLVSTGFWAVCFMGSIVVEALDFSLDSPSSMGLFRFPTVCIIGFIPHVMVLAGTLTCFAIYAIALVLSAMEPPGGRNSATRPLSFRQRLALAHENMQANISLSDIRISREMDFYTALLRTGFGVITMASEAVYLNEDRGVNQRTRTWLEEERLRELETLHMQWAGLGMGASRYDSVGTIGLVPIKDGQLRASSGYARERAAQKIPKQRIGEKRVRDGVGATERSSRWLLALEFVMSINKLVLRWCAVLLLKLLARIGVRTQPRILLWFSRFQKVDQKDQRQRDGDKRSINSRSGRSNRLYNDETTDVEAEVRRRLRTAPETASIPDEEIDSRLYSSWKHGALWGSVDTSGNWEPNEDDDQWDTTSMANSIIGEEDEQGQWVDEDEEEDDGQRTPTQASRQFSVSRESTPFDQPLAMDDLARLLRPTSPEERREAHALAAHLASDGIVTRSKYARMQQNQRGRLLLPPRQLNRGKLSDEEEAEILEDLIIARRNESAREQELLNEGDVDDDGRGGPQCVVCHSAPRKIIVWPCRCLSLCDECRVTLAMNNFDKCVCCRREVASFSRIYVP